MVAKREIAVVWAVTKGSFLNKLILVPVALLIGAFAPWAITPILMVGGLYLCFEGVEKVHHALQHRGKRTEQEAEKHLKELAENPDPKKDETEAAKIKGAIRTDLIISAEVIAIALDAEERIAKADLVITAEGSLDSQTLEGKTPHGVSRLARKYGIPVYALAGRLADEELLHLHFDGIASIANSPMTLAEAVANAPELLQKAATRLAHTLKSRKV